VRIARQVFALLTVLSVSCETIPRKTDRGSVLERSEPAKAWTAYFGNLHAHSQVSDGVESPATAFAWARDEGKLHFLCLSEHNHMVDAAELATVNQAASDATSASFVGLVGQEYSKLPPNGGNRVEHGTEPTGKRLHSGCPKE